MTARERYSDNPAFLLLKALITGQKIFYATSDGNVNKKTLVCSDLTSVSDQDGNQVHIVDPNSDANGQTRDISGDTTAGTINVTIAFDTKITEATAFIITGIRSAPVEIAAVQTVVDAIKLKTDLLNFTSGSGTLNDANGSDTIVPSSLPTKIHLTFDISNLNNNADDFTIEVKVGASGSERVVAYYNLTSDGTDITADTGTGLGSIIKQRRIDISDILCFTSEQVIVELTKNGMTDRNVAYNYLCGA